MMTGFVKRLRPSHICAIFAIVYLWTILAANQMDPMAFVRLGGHFDPRAGGQAMGYDGQFGYQIARDPLNGWHYVDVPAYRYQRILYPIIVFILSLGQSAAVPWLLVLVNLAAYLAGIRLLEVLLEFHQKSRWFALIYGLFIGVLMSLRLDLTELTAYTFVLAGIYSHTLGKRKLSVLFLALAVLAKEITLLFLAAFVLAEFLRNRKAGFLFGLAGAAPFILWKCIVFLWLGDWGLNSGGAMAAPFEIIPYFGWWKAALYAPQAFFTISLLIIPLVILPSLAGLWISTTAIFHHQVDSASLSLLFTALLIPFLPSSNIVDPLGISRALIGLVVAFIYFGAKQNSRRVLNYCLLFCMTAVFIWHDMFVPVGIFKAGVPDNNQLKPYALQMSAAGIPSRGYIPESCTRCGPDPLNQTAG
jgi:hypothetical protein